VVVVFWRGGFHIGGVLQDKIGFILGFFKA